MGDEMGYSVLFEEIADDDDDVSEEPMAWIGVDACGDGQAAFLISGQCWMDHRKRVSSAKGRASTG